MWSLKWNAHNLIWASSQKTFEIPAKLAPAMSLHTCCFRVKFSTFLKASLNKPEKFNVYLVLGFCFRSKGWYTLAVSVINLLHSFLFLSKKRKFMPFSFSSCLSETWEMACPGFLLYTYKVSFLPAYSLKQLPHSCGQKALYPSSVSVSCWIRVSYPMNLVLKCRHDECRLHLWGLDVSLILYNLFGAHDVPFSETVFDGACVITNAVNSHWFFLR